MTNNETKVITGVVRFSYVHLASPYASKEDQKPSYSMQIIIPKTDTVTLSKFKAAIEAAKVLGKDKLANKQGIMPPVVKTSLRDGDTDPAKAGDPLYAGCYFMNIKTYRRPQVVDAGLVEIDPMEIANEVYSGCYGRVSINFYAYDNSGNKGIAAGLNNVQKLQDGEPLGGGSTAKQDFGDGADPYSDIL